MKRKIETENNFQKIISQIQCEKSAGQIFPIVLNLCDGDEVNGTPGISVIRKLEEQEIIYTGANEYFYTITTSKVPMKRAFDEYGVPNAKWMSITSPKINAAEVMHHLNGPIIVKPAVSGGSMGVGTKNVVEKTEDLKGLLEDLFKGYKGWDLTIDGLIAEKYIPGPEYTVFISGSYDQPEAANIYMPVERVFHPSLSAKERFLSFDRLWEIYEKESSMPQQENFYEYGLPDPTLIEPIKKLSWDAFIANKAVGYARIDIRMDGESGDLYVLETNAQCGLSEDENYTSIGAILRFSNKPFYELIEEIIIDAISRAQIKKWI
jgi:D-alanine-D-alanine ligase